LTISRVDEITQYYGATVINSIKPSEWAVNTEIKGTPYTLKKERELKKT